MSCTVFISFSVIFSCSLMTSFSDVKGSSSVTVPGQRRNIRQLLWYKCLPPPFFDRFEAARSCLLLGDSFMNTLTQIPLQKSFSPELESPSSKKELSRYESYASITSICFESYNVKVLYQIGSSFLSSRSSPLSSGSCSLSKIRFLDPRFLTPRKCYEDHIF